MSRDVFYTDDWPQGRAPAEWFIGHGHGGYSSHARLWVAPPVSGNEFGDDVWTSDSYPVTGERSMAAATRKAIEMARELERDRDLALVARVMGGAYGSAMAA